MALVWQGPKTRTQALTEALGPALGKGLANFTGSYLANRALDDLISNPIYKDKSVEQRLEALQTRLSPFGEYGENVFNRRLKIEQQAEMSKERKRQEKEQRVLSRVYSGEKVSPEELSNLSAPSQIKLMQLQQKQEMGANKLSTEQLASQSFSKGYGAILDNDIEALKKVISDPNTPLSVKTQLSNMQNQASVRADVKAREVRSRQNMVQNAYKKAIDAERSKIGKVGGLTQKEIEGINRRMDELSKLRQKDMKKLLKDPESYSSLAIWGDSAGDYLPGEEAQAEMVPDEGQIAETAFSQAPRKPQVRFDKNNPAHVARANKVLAEAGGDRAEANRILAQEFIK